MTVKKLSRMAQQAKELLQCKAHDIGNLFMAHTNIKKANKERCMASGVIISVKDLSGKYIVEPFMISDGLSDSTIAAIQADIKATYDLRLSLSKL